jgi:hypothetical protein
LALAAVLLTLSMTAARNSGTDQPATAAGAAATGSPGAAPTPTAAAAPTAAPEPLKGPNTYAGRVDGGSRVTIAIAARDGKAIAYLCDGRSVEEWLQGTAAGGTISLTGKTGTLTASYRGDLATGTVTSRGKSWTFRVPIVEPPSRLYRATATVRGATVVAGWIYVNGEFVGAYTTNGGEPQPAPTLDTSSNTAVIDGTTVTANPVQGGPA